jgi:Carboxypeptidase regulatory-like domain
MRIFACTVWFIVATAAGFAQQGGGSIGGTIFDRLGRFVFHAPVEVTNIETGMKYTTESDRAGAYMLSLPRGTYRLSIEIAGRKYTQESIIIIPEHPLRQDVTFPLP